MTNDDQQGSQSFLWNGQTERWTKLPYVSAASSFKDQVRFLWRGTHDKGTFMDEANATSDWIHAH